MSTDVSWKDKYLKELEDAEAREAEWSSHKNLLERMLVRTSLASEGQSRELDSLLSRLRDEIRKEPPDHRAWQELQDRIDRKVSALDDRKAETNDQLRATFEKLLAELRRTRSFDPVKDRLKALEKRLRKPDTLRNQFHDWLTDFADVLQSGLGDPAAGPAEDKGLLGRLFGRSSEANRQAGSLGVTPSASSPEPPPVGRADALSSSTAQPEPVELEPPGEEESDQRLRIARRVGELLGQMLEQVSLEPAAEARARRLRESLMASDDWDELREGLNGVAELVIAAVTRSQLEFEAFLRKLDERLDTLKQYFAEQESAQAGRQGASAELDQEIQQELEAFGKKIETSQDFQALKASVSGHLKSIREAVGRFRTKETEREKVLSEQLATMHEKMAAMETQTEQVRGELREQRRRAMTDVLTELPNREAWQDRLAIEHQRWQRYAHPLSLAVLDIDCFKKVNDSYGHKAGDRVLQLVAKALRDRLRQTDFIARFGGEEFVLLFPETTADVAKTVLDGLREHIKALPFHFRGEPVSVTFSAGVAGFETGDQADEVFDRADRSLYQAKETGRDRVCVAERVPQ